MKNSRKLALIFAGILVCVFSLVFCEGDKGGSNISDGPVQPVPTPPIKAARDVTFVSLTDGALLGPIEILPGVRVSGQNAAILSGNVILNPGTLFLEWDDGFPQINVHYVDNVALGTMSIRAYDAEGLLLAQAANDEIFINAVVVTKTDTGAYQIEIKGNDSEIKLITLADPIEQFSFASTQSFSLPAGPLAIVVVDLNKDEIKDVVVLTPNELFVFTGLPGSDYLSSPSSYIIGSNTAGMVAGDFTGDGYSDIAVIISSSSTIMLFENDGMGGFVWPTSSFSTCLSPVSAVAGLIDGDTKMDIAVVCDFSSQVWIHEDGSPSGFANVIKLSTGAFGSSGVAIGHFNTDGQADLATANTSGSVSLLLSDGLGGYLPPTTFSVGASVMKILVGDLNSDLNPDILVLDETAGEIIYLEGDGTGSFAGAQAFPTGLTAGGFVLAELSNDGLLDVALPNSPSGASILIGDGKGALLSPMPLDAGFQPTAIAVDDFNGDGLKDLIFANGATGQLNLLINQSQ